MRKFTLEIELGNEAMQTWPDIAYALRRVATELNNNDQTGWVWDDNGNRVGKYQVEEPLNQRYTTRD